MDQLKKALSEDYWRERGKRELEKVGKWGERQLAGYIYALTGSATAVALITVLNKAGIMIPQLIVGNFAETFPRRRPLYALAAGMRVMSMVFITISMFLLVRFNNPAMLALFYGAVFIRAAASGSIGILFNDMLGRLIPAHRIGSLLGLRKFLGGVFAIMAGAAIIQPILGGLDFPLNYYILAIIGTLLLFIQHSVWYLCREHPGQSIKKRSSLADTVRRGFMWLKEDWNYRCYLWIRISFRFSYVGLAFFIPYGTETLKYGSETGGLAVLGGILVAVLKASELIASLLWSKVCDLKGPAPVLQTGALITFMAPLIAFTAGRLPAAFYLNIPGLAHDLTLPLSVYFVALACMGAGFSGLLIAGQQFLITTAPTAHRPSYLAFINTIIIPLTFLPLLGAMVSNLLGMDALFLMVACGASVGIIAAFRMRSMQNK